MKFSQVIYKIHVGIYVGVTSFYIIELILIHIQFNLFNYTVDYVMLYKYVKIISSPHSVVRE